MSEEILRVGHLSKTFTARNLLCKAVDDVSFAIAPGEALGLVGESGCGKSTVAKLITKLIPQDSGDVILCGENIGEEKGYSLRKNYKNVQMIFQDPITSFDPRIPIGKSIASVLLRHGICPRSEVAEQVKRLLTQVGLPPEYAGSLPIHISGGECQRAAIARALAVYPKLLICDEATSALDVSVQAQIMELLQKIGIAYGMSFLFISHDLSLVTAFCQRVCVMYQGKIVETATAAELLHNPCHPYTKLLLSSVFPVKDDGSWQLPKIEDSTDGKNTFCNFWQRCPQRQDCHPQTGVELLPLNQKADHLFACSYKSN